MTNATRTTGEHEGHVLVVDDDEDARRLAVFVMEDAGFTTVEAETGDQALRILAAESVDAVLLDYSMPGMDGLECLGLIRRLPETTRTPVLMLTARGDIDDVTAGLEGGADDYVVKPYAPDELVARVRRHVTERATWATLVEQEVDRRSALLAAAQSVSTTATLQQGAMQVSETLCSVEDIRGVTIAEIAGDVVAALASKGDDPLALLVAATGRHDLGRELAEKAADGGWVEPLNDPLTAGVVSIAPIRVDDTVVGLVLALPEPDTTKTGIDRIHATTLDFGRLAAGILGGPLLDTARRDDERRRVAGPVERGEFTTVFQPIVDLASGASIGHEALTRFSPDDDTATMFARANLLGLRRLFEMRTLEAAITASSALPADAWLAVNVSPSVLTGEDLDPVLSQAGDRTVVLELSEVERVTDYDAIRDAVHALGRNVVLSVDDAGAGFASLAHVLALRATFVKIDRSWVHGIEHDPAKRALVAGIHNFATETGAVVIAEGIETESELAAVVSLGITLGQGFLLGRPAAA